MQLLRQMQCLNPYCNGRYSLRVHWNLVTGKMDSLNPYCNGRYSLSLVIRLVISIVVRVLILIVMEDTH